ncbi:MAG: GFA family protein [Pseudobdellovibrionaceae bacterium]
MNKVTGQCYCKKISFEIQLPTEFVSHCHCESCRTSHGSAFVTWGGVAKNQFRFLLGENLLKKYSSSPQVRWCFCSECGTSLLYDCDYAPEKIYFTLANITGDLDRKPDSHVSYEERIHWFPFKDDLPKFKEKSDERMD